jgi:DNA polymerase-3 subunit delta
MKINITALEPHLKKNLAALYLISGNEIQLMNEAVTAIKQTASQQDFTTERTYIGKDFSWQNLLATVKTPSLFDPKRVIIVDATQAKRDATFNQWLSEFAKKPLQQTILVILTDKLEKTKVDTQLADIATKAGIHLALWPLADSELYAWIRQKAARLGLQLATESMRLLAEFTEGNLLACHQELEKLFLEFGNTLVTPAHLQERILYQADFNVFALTESCLSGNVARSMQIINRLQEEGMEPLLIVGLLARECRLLIQLAAQPQQQRDAACQKLNIFPKQRGFYQRAIARNADPRYWSNLLQQTAKLDALCKGMRCGDIWQNIQQLCTLIAQPPAQKRATLGILPWQPTLLTV